MARQKISYGNGRFSLKKEISGHIPFFNRNTFTFEYYDYLFHFQVFCKNQKIRVF